MCLIRVNKVHCFNYATMNYRLFNMKILIFIDRSNQNLRHHQSIFTVLTFHPISSSSYDASRVLQKICYHKILETWIFYYINRDKNTWNQSEASLSPRNTHFTSHFCSATQNNFQNIFCFSRQWNVIYKIPNFYFIECLIEWKIFCVGRILC